MLREKLTKNELFSTNCRLFMDFHGFAWILSKTPNGGFIQIVVKIGSTLKFRTFL
jgi:hypothetical protein